MDACVVTPGGARKLPTSLRAAIVFNLIVTLTLLPVAGQPFDLAGLTGTAGAWLRWGVPLFYHWKFGVDLTAVAIGANAFGFVLEHLGMGGAAALTTAWKLPLVAANIVTALVLYDIAKRLDTRHPTLAPLLWLLSPVPIFVAAGFGDVEPLTVLAFVLAIDLILRRRLIGSGIVIGLGIGIEYLPILILVVVIFAVAARLLTKREAAYICVPALATTAVCFLPLFLTSIGRSSLFAGLHSSAAATSATQNALVGAARSSSLWLLLGGVSPGREWIMLGGVLCLSVAAALAVHARHRGGSRTQPHYFVAATAAMLLIVVLMDPEALPQFSDLVFGGLCLLSLVISIPAWSLIAGPFLQLLTGIVWVYGGSFESFWYDMWATTGRAGWNLPQSAIVATWAGIAGIVIIVLGLVAATTPSDTVRRITKRIPVFAVSIACAGSVFFGVWSAQPAYWQGVGPNGPSMLPDFGLMTASQSLPVRYGQTTMTVKLPRGLWPLPKEPARDKKPYLSLTVGLKSLVIPQGVDYPQALPAEVGVSLESLGVHAKVTSLWVEALVGRNSWTSQHSLKTGAFPVLLSGTKKVQDTGAHWETPGWVALTYSLPLGNNALPKHMVLSLRGGKGIIWNGSRNERWLLVAVRSMTLPLVVNGQTVDTYIAAPAPWPYSPFEQVAVARGLPVSRQLTVRMPTRAPGDPTLEGVTLRWPTSVPVDARTGPTALVLMGLVYVAMIGAGSLGGAWLISLGGEHRRSSRGKRRD